MSEDKNDGNEIPVTVMPELTSLEMLRAWYHEHKGTPEFALAMKHKAAMDPAVVAELKSRAPGDSDEEKELGLVFGLTQIAHKLDTVSLLLGNMRIEHMPPTKPEVVATSHVDVTPLGDVPSSPSTK